MSVLPKQKPEIALRRVIKFGGSLLDQPDIEARLKHWLDNLAPAQQLWIAGGGKAVEAIRQADQIDPQPPGISHWQAIAWMDENATQLQKMLPGSWLVKNIKPTFTRDVRDDESEHRNFVLQPQQWLKERGEQLPESWTVTSDSIAAWVAMFWGANELVLLKSCDPPNRRADWAKQGFVDEYFDELNLESTRVVVVNLGSSTT